MPIVDLLRKNAREYGDEVALVELNPEHAEKRRVTWKEYELIEPSNTPVYRREITWKAFDEQSNRFANLLLKRGLGKGKKVAILLMNCLEWLPVYFGILKAGALAVPLNFRYTADEIKYCLGLAEVDALVFGPEFIGRIEELVENSPELPPLFYLNGTCPTFAESYFALTAEMPTDDPMIPLTEQDDALVSRRHYKAPMNEASARAELLAGSGTQFDPRMVRIFIGLLDDGTIAKAKEEATTQLKTMIMNTEET